MEKLTEYVKLERLSKRFVDAPAEPQIDISDIKSQYICLVNVPNGINIHVLH